MGDENVLGFDVPVDNALPVQIAHHFEQLKHDLFDAVEPGQPVGDRLVIFRGVLPEGRLPH